MIRPIPTTAYSDSTETEYESWDKLIEAEASGYVLVVLFRSKDSRKGNALGDVFARIEGVYPDMESARRKNAAARDRVKRRLAKMHPAVRPELLGVHAEPIWNRI